MGNSNSKQSSKHDKKSSSSSSASSSSRPKNKKSQSSNNVVTREHERPALTTRHSHGNVSKSTGNIPSIVTEQHSPEKAVQDSKSATLSRSNTAQSNKSVKSRRSLNNLSTNHHNDDMPQIKKQISNIETQNSNNIESSPHSNKSYNHKRSHSQNLFHHNNGGGDNHLLPRSNRTSNVNSRRSSFNNNTDLPPSMIQVEPKPPILKNSKYTQSAHSFQYYENALTDDDNDNNNNNNNNNNDDDDNNNNGNTSYSVQTSTNPDSTTKSSRQGSIRHSHSSRPSSIKSGISSSSRQRRKSDNNLSISSSKNPDFIISQSRSNSFVSSSHSRKSSLGSNTNTAYSTPLNSPGVQQLLQHNKNESQDYFGIQSTPNGTDNGNDTMDSTAIDGSTPHHRHHHHHHRSSSSVNNINENGIADNSLVNTPDGDSNSYAAVSKMDQYPSGLDAFNTPIGDTDVASNLGFNGLGSKKKKVYKPIDIDDTIQKLLDAGYAAKRTKNVCLKNSEIAQICQQAREIFLSQPSLLELSPPVKIVGDVHGQYGDLLRLFTKCGFPPQSNYLFLGDYVDRGKQSLETILLLLCYKIKYPENFFILRGNHECANVTRVYGFYDECKRRCNIKTWKGFIDTFNTLPLAAIVAGKIFCVHGGLSPVLNSMDEIRHVSRPTDVPDFGLINDLLWSDPTDSPNEWEDNERGVSYCYNKVAINKFLNKFGFDLVCRAHMVVEDGYEFFNDRSLVTVFSAPNYCGEFDNWGAVMSVSDGLLCSFELLDPLDSAALKQVMKKGRQERKVANHQQLHDQR